MLKLALRTIGMILGLLASAIVLIIDILYSLTNTLDKLAGNTGFSSHFFIGLLVTLIGVVGAFLADPLPMASVLLMLIAAIGFFFLVGAWAIIPGVIFLIALALVFFDRNRAKA
ncbi:MAG TPA: hypothetical protein VE338_19685 [Ktedonobacterales bacterium]|jgi:hypothetical protein|nr:hypothetical protein [Ktedonobacterales bacterium]